MADELENIATVVAPEVGLPLKVTKWVLIGVGAIILLAAGSWVVWKLFFAEHAAEQKHEQVTQQVNQGLANAGQQSGQQAVKITVDNQTHAAAVDRETQKAINELLSKTGANQPVDPNLAILARRAICMRSSAAGLDGCKQLLNPSP